MPDKSMKEAYNLIVVIPVGPDSVLDFVLDTIESVTYFTGRNRKIVVIDDTGEANLCAKLELQLPDLEIIKTPRNYGPNGGLYLKHFSDKFEDQ